MFWQRIVWPLSLLALLIPAGCKSQAQDPLLAAQTFLEIADGAAQEQFVDLYAALGQRLCQKDRQVLEQNLENFRKALPSEIEYPPEIHTADLITSIRIPEGLNLDEGRILSQDRSSVHIGFRKTNAEKEAPSLTLKLVLEGTHWRICGLLGAI